MMILVTAAALYNRVTKQFLVQQRPEGSSMAGLWEFPGGKIEAGEAPDVALCRELAEELNLIVHPDDCTPLTFNTDQLLRPDGTTQPLLLLLYLCTHWQGDPHPNEGQKMAWHTLEELAFLDMPPADRPFLHFLCNSVIKM